MRFLTLVFFIKQLLLFLLDMPRKDFKFFWIFKKLFVFVIDSPVYSLPGSRDSLVSSPLGSRPKFVFFYKLASTKYTMESKLPRDQNIEESWLPDLFVTIKFFCKPVLMLVPNTPRSWLPGVFITGELFWTPGSRFGHRGVVLPILWTAQQSLKELSF
jgi:hypothetical protein